MSKRINSLFRTLAVACLLVVFNVSVFADAEETWHQKWFYLETMAGYNIQNGDIPLGLAFTFQRYRVGPYVSVMYGFRNTVEYVPIGYDGPSKYNPTRFGWYASGGFSFRIIGDWSPVDAQAYIGPAWRCVATASDLKNWEKLSEEQKNTIQPQYIGRWGGEFGIRLGGGRAGKRFAVWSGSIGLKIFYIGERKFEIMPQVGLSMPIGGPLGVGGACTLLWL